MSDSTIKKGRKPLSKRQGPMSISHEEIYGNATALGPELAKELESQGLKPRWVDYKQMKGMDGYHRSGWRIYHRKNCGTIDNQEVKFGQSPDGIVRRGSLVLAVKTKEQVDKHKRFLREKAERYSVKAKKRQVDELRQLASNAGLDTTIKEGYDD